MKVNKIVEEWFFNLIDIGEIQVFNNGTIESIDNKLKCGNQSDGYIRASYKSKGIQAHRLVYYKFKGIIPENIQVNHKDGNKQNNNILNLELVTNSQNVKHSFDFGLTKITSKTKQIRKENILGEKNSNSKFKDSDVVLLRKKYKENKVNIAEIEVEFNIAKITIRAMLLGHTYNHLPNILTKQEYKRK